MAEYIEREAALKKVDTAIGEYARHGEIVRFIGDCRASIIYAHTTDVVKVRHGEWVPSLHHYGLYMCSECQCSDEKCQPSFDKRNAWKKCPNCGAKMDGKGESE